MQKINWNLNSQKNTPNMGCLLWGFRENWLRYNSTELYHVHIVIKYNQDYVALEAAKIGYDMQGSMRIGHSM